MRKIRIFSPDFLNPDQDLDSGYSVSKVNLYISKTLIPKDIHLE